MAANNGSNDVWSTLSHALDIYGNVATAKIKSTAAPSGNIASGSNPSPGAFGPYPQAQTKPPQGPGGSVASSVGSALSLGLGVGPNVVRLLIVGLLILVFAARRG